MPQMPSIQDDQTHALLIGVDDYTSFERSGKSDLKGSRNDVLLLASYCIEVLGLRAENIVALTWPLLTEQDFEQHVSMRGGVMGDAVQGIVGGEAKEAEVTKRLADLLAFSQGGTALLTFSGHGAAVPDGPMLCLGDTAPGFTSGVLSLTKLRDDIKNAYAERRLIALLDCCHVAAPPHAQRLQGTSLPHTVAPEDVMKQEDLFRVSNRVLLAARPGMEAYQMRFGKVWHGALTFALVTAAERWKGENQVSHGSYKHVLKRARGTLKALGVPQKSELRMPAAERAEIRTSPFLGVKPGHPLKKPDAAEICVQLPSDWLITISLGTKDGTILAQIVTEDASNACKVLQGTSDQATFGTGSLELWYLNTDALKLLQSTESIVITSKPLIPVERVLSANLDAKTKFAFGGGTPCVPTFTTPEASPGNPWRTGAPIVFPSTNSYYFTTSDSGAALGVLLVVPASGSTNPLTAAVWYQVFSAPRTNAPIDIQPGSSDGVVYRKSATVPSSPNVAWFAASAPGS